MGSYLYVESFLYFVDAAGRVQRSDFHFTVNPGVMSANNMI